MSLFETKKLTHHPISSDNNTNHYLKPLMCKDFTNKDVMDSKPRPTINNFLRTELSF